MTSDLDFACLVRFFLRCMYSSQTHACVGDTVNVASRMESTGLPCSIQISYRVVRALPEPDLFHIITRGRIEVKGKGTMKTFLLLNHVDSCEPPLLPRLAKDEAAEDVWSQEAGDCDSGNGNGNVSPRMMQRPTSSLSISSMNEAIRRPVRLNPAVMQKHEQTSSTQQLKNARVSGWQSHSVLESPFESQY